MSTASLLSPRPTPLSDRSAGAVVRWSVSLIPSRSFLVTVGSPRLTSLINPVRLNRVTDRVLSTRGAPLRLPVPSLLRVCNRPTDSPTLAYLVIPVVPLRNIRFRVVKAMVPFRSGLLASLFDSPTLLNPQCRSVCLKCSLLPSLACICSIGRPSERNVANPMLTPAVLRMGLASSRTSLVSNRPLACLLAHLIWVPPMARSLTLR